MSKLDKTFTATLLKSPSRGGWTYVVMPGSVDYFGTRGLVKVRGTVWSCASARPRSNLAACAAMASATRS